MPECSHVFAVSVAGKSDYITKLMIIFLFCVRIFESCMKSCHRPRTWCANELNFTILQLHTHIASSRRNKILNFIFSRSNRIDSCKIPTDDARKIYWKSNRTSATCTTIKSLLISTAKFVGFAIVVVEPICICHKNYTTLVSVHSHSSRAR